ncbi:MAG: energy-coupling factor transporter transmembrane protein EcfT [Atopobiaceae bacterium]|nr:energy-coupling factor transporter transmembrane protein EcfT [Atopobiaceae bacterium]
MDFDLYGDDSRDIIKLDPRTKLLLFLASSVVSLNLYGITSMVVFSSLLCLLLALCGRPGTALKSFIVFAIVAYFRACLEAQGTGSAGVVMIVQALATIFMFMFPVLISLIMLVQTTRISQFLAAFQAMHLPATITIPVAVLFRFIPAVQDEWNGIRKAMAFRGIRIDAQSVVRQPFKTIEYMLVPLLFSSISVMEELAAAAEARGLDAEHERTSYENVRLGIADYVVIALFGGIALYTALNVRRVVLGQ